MLQTCLRQNRWNAAKKIKSKGPTLNALLTLSKHNPLFQIIKYKNISSVGIPYEMQKKTKLQCLCSLIENIN